MQRNDINSPSSADHRPSSPGTDTVNDVTTLILVRHGETAWNRIKRMQGQIDIPLSEVGIAQADLLAARVAREGAAYASARNAAANAADVAHVRDQPSVGSDDSDKATGAVSDVERDRLTLARIDAVVSSDLSRAMQTALPIAAAAGCAVVTDSRLRERHYGVFQAHDSEQVRAQWPADHARWIAHDPDFAPEGGESLRQLSLRVRSALSAIARDYRGKTVVCVAHGGVLDCAYRFAQRLPLDTPREHLLLNASANTIAWHSAPDPNDDHATMLLWGDVTHLTYAVDAADTAARDDE